MIPSRIHFYCAITGTPQAAFTLKGPEIKVLVPARLRRGCVNFFLLQPFTGRPGLEVSWELNKDIFASCSLPGRQGSQRWAIMCNLTNLAFEIGLAIFWSSHRGAAEMNPTRNHEVAGSIPGLVQWVKDLALP